MFLARARIAQIIAQNLVVSPIQVLAYLVSVSIINGAKNAPQIKKTVKYGFWRVLRVSSKLGL